MKNAKILFVAFCVICTSLLSSCSKSVKETNFVGKWQSIRYEYQEYEGCKLVGEGSENCIDFYLGFEFKSDGKGTLIYYEEGDDSEVLPMRWVLMDSKLMVTPEDGDSATTWDVESISGSRLVLSTTEEGTSGGEKWKEVETYIFKKL